MRLHYACLLTAACCSLSPILSSQSSPNDDPPTLDSVRRAIESMERRFRNVRLIGTLKREARANESAEWKYYGGARVSALFADGPGGKAHLIYEDMVTPWVSGDAPFVEEDLEVAYDGRVGTILYKRSGPRGRPLQLKRGAITPGRTNRIDWGTLVTGWQMSIFGFHDETGQWFSDALGKDDSFQVEHASDTAKGAVRIRRSYGPVEESWIVDLARGAALLEYEVRVKKVRRKRFVVHELAESDGLYFPRRYSRYVWPPEDLEERHTIEVESVIANVAAIDHAKFKLTFPTGTFLEDHASDVSLHVGLDPAGLQDVVSKNARALRASLDGSEPVSASALAGFATRQMPDAGGSWFWFFLLGGLGFLVLAPAVLRGMQKRRRVPVTAALLATLAIGTSSVTAQRRSLGADELGSQRIANCGLNSTAVILETFGRSVELQELARCLDCGEHWERPCSLLAIQVLLQSRGLLVRPFKRATPGELLRGVGNGHLALVHCDGKGADDGHFLLVGGTRRDSVLRVDAGVDADWVKLDDFRKEFEFRMSGYGLFVSDGTVASTREYTTQEDLIRVDIGDVSEVQGAVSADIKVRNPRRAPIRIHHAKASCSCFQRAEFVNGGDTLKPGDRDVLRLTFDKTKLPAGESKQKIRITIEDTEKRVLRLEVRSVHRKAEARRRVAALPKTLNLGTIRDRAQLTRPHRVSLTLPPGVSVRSTKTSSDRVRLVPIAKSSDRGNAYRMPSQAVTYECRIDADTTGVIDEELTFELTDMQLRTVRVPIRGTVRLDK